MNVTGLIVEYNPFHNGHDYHFQRTKEETHADLVIAVMSGNFLQRGEPALLSKWARTQMALEAGIDLVVELPYAFATQKAEIFANGAVSILDALGATHLCFGSEQGNMQPFLNTLFFTQGHQAEYDLAIKANLDKGYSYPKAHALAFQILDKPQEPMIDLAQPNNILGYHYLKAAKEQDCQMKVTTIKRVASGYHDDTLSNGSIASATSIRKSIFEENGQLEDIRHKVPDFTFRLLENATRSNKLYRWEDFFRFLKYRCLSVTPEDLAEIYEAEEGLEHRMIRLIHRANNFAEFMNEFKTKRYTWTRLQRLCTHTLTNTKKSDMIATLSQKKATYIRLLGMNQKGQAYLNKKKHDLKLPLFTKVSKAVPSLMNLDIKAANLYEVAHLEANRSARYPEVSQTPLRYDEDKKRRI